MSWDEQRKLLIAFVICAVGVTAAGFYRVRDGRSPDEATTVDSSDAPENRLAATEGADLPPWGETRFAVTPAEEVASAAEHDVEHVARRGNPVQPAGYVAGDSAARRP